jgi:hypothetical protein
VGQYAGEANTRRTARSPGRGHAAPASQEALKNAAQADSETGGTVTGNYASADLVLGLVAGPDAEINPLHAKYRDVMTVNALVYESLVELDENRQPSPLLADRWTVTGNTWMFTLRSTVSFHNGERLTAQDVVASYNEIMKYPANYWQPLLSQAVDTMTAADESTVVVKAKGSIGYMLRFPMTFPCLQRHGSAAQPFGTGLLVHSATARATPFASRRTRLVEARRHSHPFVVASSAPTTRCDEPARDRRDQRAGSEYPPIALSAAQRPAGGGIFRQHLRVHRPQPAGSDPGGHFGAPGADVRH